MTNMDCPAAFSPVVRAGIISAFQSAYAEADALYAPERGVGDRVHAMAVYEVASMRLERDVAGTPGIRFVSRGRGPELEVGRLRVRWNKVRTAGEGIEGSFPRGSYTAIEMAAQNDQLRLWSDGDLALPNWIIAHLGDPRQGLRAIYLAAPIEAAGGRISAWHTVVPIWSVDDPKAEFPSAPLVGLPEPPPLPDFDITFVDDEPAADASG